MIDRPVSRIVEGVAAEDGAGVRLTRIIGSNAISHHDPFLLLDEFKSDNADDYIAGFPAHPHRGFETVTYLKAGNFRHRDSKGNEGFLGPGSVQWMTAGRGIIHSEMPEMKDGLLWGYQLWLNLPARLKMTEPRYQDIPAPSIPVVERDGVRVTVIAGEVWSEVGPASSWYPVLCLDVTLEPDAPLEVPVPGAMSCFAYLYDGGFHWADQSSLIPRGKMVIAGMGDRVRVRAGPEGSGFLLAAADRIGEPIARAGPFVMNTREEISQAFADYQNGTLAL